eukprot:scaffold27877_cov45-Attheya_sp.AAC.1
MRFERGTPDLDVVPSKILAAALKLAASLTPSLEGDTREAPVRASMRRSSLESRNPKHTT